MVEKCGNCQYKKKYPFSTYYKCEKHNVIITSSPAIKCDACLKEEGKDELKSGNKTLEDTIEVL